MITMENTRELIDFEYYGKSYRMAPEEIEAAYRYQEMQYRKADALRMLTSYAFGMGAIMRTANRGEWKHWYNGCVLSGFVIKTDKIEAWNRRASDGNR